MTSLNTSVLGEDFFLNTENNTRPRWHKEGMIPEPGNKKGAFAPFDNRTLLIIFIVRTF